MVKRGSGGILHDLGEAMRSVQLEETIDRRKQIPVVEDAEAGAEDERRDRRPGESNARAEVQGMLRQGSRKPVIVVTQAVVDSQSVNRSPVVLNISLDPLLWEVHARIAKEGLGVEVRRSGCQRS